MMYRLILIASLIFGFIRLQASNTPNDSTIYSIADTMPSYKGGFEAYDKYLNDSLVWPDLQADIYGFVYVKFIVEKDGSINSISILRGLHEDFDNATIKFVKSMPKWNPGKIKNKPVRTRMILPVKFYRE